MWTWFWLAAGVVLGLVFVSYARDHGPRGEIRVYAVGLVAAAAVYVVLAALGASMRWVGIETLGVLVFTGISALGLGTTPKWLVVGWAVHAGWDVALHLMTRSGIVGTWYPIACVPFDLILAGAIVLHMTETERKSFARL